MNTYSDFCDKSYKKSISKSQQLEYTDGQFEIFKAILVGQINTALVEFQKELVKKVQKKFNLSIDNAEELVTEVMAMDMQTAATWALDMLEGIGS